MRGTGSHDVRVIDVFVPARRTALLAPYEKPGSAYQGRLYKIHRLDRDFGHGTDAARDRTSRPR